MLVDGFEYCSKQQILGSLKYLFGEEVYVETAYKVGICVYIDWCRLLIILIIYFFITIFIKYLFKTFSVDLFLINLDFLSAHGSTKEV